MTSDDGAAIQSTTAAVRRMARIADNCHISVGMMSRGIGRSKRAYLEMHGISRGDAEWLASYWGGTASLNPTTGLWGWRCRKGALRIARKLLNRDGLQTAAQRRKVLAGIDTIVAVLEGDDDD